MTRSRRSSLPAVIVGLATVITAWGPAPGASAQELTHVYVVVTSDGDAAGLAREVTTAGGDVTAEYAAVDVVVAELTATEAAVLDGDPDVAVAPDVPIVPADSQEYPTWGLDRIDQARLPLNQRYTYPSSAGSGVRVYVVDTGVTPSPTFGDRLVAGYAAAGDGAATTDCNGHGTHVAGTVASTEYGVAKRATIVPVRVFTCEGGGTTSMAIAGLNWIIANHPTGSPGVVNMSLTSARHAALDQAVATVVARGFVVAVAAGNDAADACSYSPAGAPSALTTAASDALDGAAPYSNSGACVDLYAPGTGVTSVSNTGAPQVRSGTSMASPHVAGVAALYLSERPTASPAEVSSEILSAATTRIPGAPAGTADRLLSALLFTPPGVPAGVQVDAVTMTTAHVSWTAPASSMPITAYTVSYRVGTDAPDVPWQTQSVASTSATLTGLSAGAGHEVRVSAANAFGTSAESGVVEFWTAWPPGAPLGLRATGATTSSVDLTWDAVVAAEPITGYLVQVADPGQGWSGGITVPGTRATATGLVAGTGYQVRVAAMSGTVTGLWSTPVTVTTSPPPSAPTAVGVSVPGPGISIKWGAPVSGASAVTGFAVQSSVNGRDWVTAVTTGAAARAATVPAPPAGVQTFYRVAALAGQSVGAPSATFRVVSGPGPGQRFISTGQTSLINPLARQRGAATRGAMAVSAGYGRR